MRAQVSSVGLREALRWSGLLVALAAGLIGGTVVAQAPARPHPDIGAKLAVLDRYIGTWDATVTTRRPKASVVRYRETFAWTLDGSFLRGDTGGKSDGSQDLVLGTYDPSTGGYPFWIFSSTGAWIYLQPGQWDEASRTLVWKNAASDPVSYLVRNVFPDARTRRWTSVVKDWKGTVVLELEGVAVRRP